MRRRLLFLLLAAVAIAGLAFVVLQQRTSDQLRPQDFAMFAEVSPDAIAAVHIAREGAERGIVRGENGFTTADGKRFPITPGAVALVAAELQGLFYAGRVASTQRPKQVVYGVGPDAPKLRVELVGQPEPIELYLGKLNERGETYVRRAGSDVTVRVPHELHTPFRLDPNDIVDRTIFDAEPADVTSVTIEYVPEPLRLVRANGAWTLPDYVGREVDEQVAKGLVIHMARLSAHAVVDVLNEGSNQYTALLTNPLVSINAKLEDGREHRITLGNWKQGLYYVSKAGSPFVYQITNEQKEWLMVSLDQLSRSAILSLKTYDIVELEIQANDQRIVVQRRGPIEWWVVTPETFRANTIEVERMVDVLAGLRMEKGYQGEFGTIVRRITAVMTDGKRHTIALGERPELGLGRALRVSDGQSFVIGAHYNTLLSKGLEDFKKPPYERAW